MKLVFFFLNKEEYLVEVMEAFVELGVNGATILDSIGMGRVLAHDIPIFAGFRNLLKESRPGNKTIVAAVSDEKVRPMLKAIEQVVGSLEENGNGIFLSLNIDFAHGISSH